MKPQYCIEWNLNTSIDIERLYDGHLQLPGAGCMSIGNPKVGSEDYE